MPLSIVPRSGGFALAVKVVPGASRQRIAGAYGEGIKVTVTKAPEAGAANDAVIALLSDVLQIPRSQIRINRGQTSPRKEVLIVGLGSDAIVRRLTASNE